MNVLIKKPLDSEISKTFKQIIENSNVEVYTYLCQSFNNSIPIERTRTLRFLPMIDDDVNICVVREADGIVSNLDCHNIKIFSKSDKIFYLPLVVPYYNNITLDDDVLFSSYSPWLQLYKVLFEQEYFSNHQNLYDLLAGTFSIKLKIKKDYYQTKILELQKKINNFFTASNSERKTKVNNISFLLSRNNKALNTHDLIDILDTSEKELNNYINILNTGFDEILLLDIFKELISIKFEESNKSTTKIFNKQIILLNNLDAVQVENHKSILFADNIKLFTIDYSNSKKTGREVHNFLQSQGVLNSASVLNISDVSLTKDNMFIITDSLLRDIIFEQPFNIEFYEKIQNKKNYLSELLNLPYLREYDHLYDNSVGGYYQKYIKYKNKYLQIKKKINL